MVESAVDTGVFVACGMFDGTGLGRIVTGGDDDLRAGRAAAPAAAISRIRCPPTV